MESPLRFLIDLAAMVFLIIGIIVLFPAAKYHFDPDALGYFRVYQHWIAGDVSLAISGYWGPLLSWIMIPIGVWFSDPAEIGRAATLVGAAVFQVGAICLLRNCTLHLKWHALAVFSTAFAALDWGSFEYASADLLLAGLFLAGYSTFNRALRTGAIVPALAAGLLFGLAYLAKTPGLLLAIGLMIVMAVVETQLPGRKDRRIIRQLSISGGAMLLVALPWITTLSVHYGKVTWTAVPGYALQWTLGLQHPSLRYFHQPADGRITSWEEPGEIEFADQIDIGLREIAQIADFNFLEIGRHLTVFDHFGLLFALTTIAFIRRRGPYADRAWDPRRIGLIGISVVLAPYLFSNAESERFFWMLMPIMLVAAFGLLNELEQSGDLAWDDTLSPAIGRHIPRLFIYGLMAVSLIYPAQDSLRWNAQRDVQRLPYPIGKAIAAKMVETGTLGPIASLGKGKYIAFYAALLGKVRHLGTQLQVANTREIIDTGARYLFVQADNPSLPVIQRDARFTDRTEFFYPGATSGKAANEIRIFEIRRAES
jgi:hypothetical protein